MTDKEKFNEHKEFHFVYYLHTVSLLYLMHYTQDMQTNTHTHTHTHLHAKCHWQLLSLDKRF